MKILCLGTYPLENAAVRYRVLQFFPYLESVGIQTTFHPFIDRRFFRRFYEPRRRSQKTLRLLGFALRRCAQVRRAREYDVILIQREAALFGPPLIETLLARAMKKPLVFDFDDATHVPLVSSTYGRYATFLKYPQKTPQIIRLSRSVIAGNRNLAEYASTLNDNVTMIPTVVDARVCRPASSQRRHSPDSPVVLGWMGSHSSYPYLKTLFPVLQEVARRRAILVRVVGAGRRVAIPGVEIDNREWSLKTELSDLQSFDIGLYPISDDVWSRGKSGFKAVQYMAVGIPAVCSPVGATGDIVQNGVHGFLPATEEQWVERLFTLITGEALRRQMGQAGRERVEAWYCLEQQAPRLESVLRAAASSQM